MRISDWSSDVCSSDLRAARRATRSGWRRRDGNWRARCGGRWPRVRTDGLGAGRGRAASQEGLGQAVRPAVLDRRFRAADDGERGDAAEVGRASGRERGCQYVSNSGVAGTLKKKVRTNITMTNSSE